MTGPDRVDHGERASDRGTIGEPEPRGSRQVGLDVGGTHVRVAARTSGRAPGSVTVHDLPPDYASFLAAASAWIGDDASAVGVGVPGRVAAGTVDWVPNIPYLDGRELAPDLARRTGASVTLANDAQCALLGELRSGAAQDGRNVVLVAIGTGIGGAVAWSGRIVRGAHGTAGAFGWLPARSAHAHDDAATDAGAPNDGVTGAATEPTEAHGGLGPWERLASGTALSRRLDAAGLDRTTLAEPDAVASALLSRYLDDLATGLAGIASTFDPHRILLSGGVADLLARHLDDLQSRMRRRASPVAHDVELRIARHGSAAGAIGAAHLAAEGEGAFLP